MPPWTLSGTQLTLPIASRSLRRASNPEQQMSEPVVVQKAPYAVDVEAGKAYFWCSCGLSKNQPFCDGAHKPTGLTPVKYEAQADGKVYFCGCKASGKKPLCDGAHKGL